MRGIFQSYRWALGGAGFRLCLLQLPAAPLAWFPGPVMDYPGSGAATVVLPGLGNVVIAGSTAYPEGLVATNGYWTPLGQPFTGNLAPGAVACGGSIILYGGNDGNSSVSTVISYSPGDGSSALASMSTPRSYLGYAPDRRGNAYAIGGLDSNGQPLSSAESYNQDSGAWAAIASLPAAQYNFPAVFDGTNQIYIFGGRTNTAAGTEIAAVLRYSVSKNTWTNLAPMPVAVAGSAATFGPDGRIYVVGGVSGGVTANVVQVFDPAANAWLISTPLPEGLSGAAMGVDSLGRLIVMGGMDTNGNDVGDVWRSQQLGSPDSPPVFTQIPGTNATYHSAYASTIAATGNPQPVFLLVNGPTNLTVDYFSGAISWTPSGVSQVGLIPVTIAATNFAGSTNLTFSIQVPNPPPTPPTNIVVVSVTDNSAVLSWAPEDPAVGPVTYSLAIPHPYHSPRGSGGGVNYQVIASGIPTNSVTLTNLLPSSGNGYNLAATGPGGTSAYGSSPGIAVFTTGPQGPTNLWLTGLTSTSVSLAWTPSPGPAQNPLYSTITSYTLMRRIVSPPENIPTVTNIIGTNATITGLAPGASSIWFVSGVDTQGYASPLAFYYVVVVNPAPVPPQLSVAASSGAGGVLSSTAGGGFQLTATATGSGLQTFLIQATTNPADPNSWVQIGSVLPTANPFTFTDTNAAQFPVRFYRIAAP